MEVIIDGKTYEYISNALTDEETKQSYLDLTKKTFGLDFIPWLSSGFYSNSFIPHTLYDAGNAVASVGVALSDFKWQNTLVKSAQISTVMTAPNYRGMGLSKWLMDLVIRKWEDKCDMVYLYANDSVPNFYPKFGFSKVSEYVCSMPITKGIGKYRKLDLSLPDDMNLLIEKYKFFNNPFSAVTMQNNLSHMMFHCITFLYDCIYYIEQYDAVVIAECDDESIFCYDIFTNSSAALLDIIRSIANEKTRIVNFGFPPLKVNDCQCEKSQEHNTTVFVLQSTLNIFDLDKIALPHLSRA